MKKVSISQVDALFANGSYPIEFLFYYKEQLQTKKIRHALQKLSSVFWPLFGEYRNGIISFERYNENECYVEDVDNGEFTVPTTEKGKWDAFSRYRLPHTERLFLFKVTQFRNGTILVPKMYHLAGDGYSYFYFLSSLALLSQKTLLPAKSSMMQVFFRPHHRRTILKDFCFQGIEWEGPQQNGGLAMEDGLVPRKDVNSSIREVRESKNFRISTNDVLSAIALRNLLKTKKESVDESVELTIPIDVRTKVKEYGRRFFGNGLMLHHMKLKKKDIMNSPKEELAIRIRRAMPAVTKPSYVDYLWQLEKILSEGKKEKFRPFDPASGFLVTNISRLPVDRLNFGTGPPDLIFPFTVEKNAAAVMARDENFILRFAF